MTELVCIIGWPVAASLSPLIHNAAFAALGLDWTYVPLGVRPGELERGMGMLDELHVRGANVTIPHKQDVIAFLGRLEGDAAAAGAVNTIARAGSELVGHNTDGNGFLRALADQGWLPDGRTAHVFGAGGAARAVVLALARAGCSVTVSARRPEQAHEVSSLDERVHATDLDQDVRADLVVQATPLRTGLPLDRVRFTPDVLAVDLIYGPPRTVFCQTAAAAGARAFDGLGMLVHQAALSFEIWTGRLAPLDAMHAAARAALDGATASP